MASYRTIIRMLAIQRVLVKYGLDDIIKETHLLRPMRFLFYLAPRRRDSSAPLGERIRLAEWCRAVATPRREIEQEAHRPKQVRFLDDVVEAVLHEHALDREHTEDRAIARHLSHRPAGG